MQKNIESLMLDADDIKKQIENLRFSNVSDDQKTESDNEETESDELSNSVWRTKEFDSFEDETETFDESLDFRNSNWQSDEELSLEGIESNTTQDSSNETSEELNQDEDKTNQQNDNLNERITNQDDKPQTESSLLKTPTEIQRDDYIIKLKEVQKEVDNLKELVADFSKNLKKDITEILFEQFSQFEKELIKKGN